MRRLPRRVCFAVIVMLVCTLSITAALPALAATQTFSNPTSIAIPAIGNANPFPSTINVSGMLGNITDVNVTLSGFGHTFPSDVDVLLVGPGSQNVLLMADVGCTGDVSGITLVFDQ